MAETTPLLLDEPTSPPRSSALRYNSSNIGRANNSRGSNFPAPRHRARVNPLNPAYLTSTSDTPKPHPYYVAQSHKTKTPLAYKQLSISPRLSQLIYSLPYKLLCIASPLIPPCCGLCCCTTCIRTSEYGVLERFGRFERFLNPGMHIIMWPYEREAGRISVRLRQLDLHCETKSKDHVFVTVRVAIQYQAIPHQLFQSFYSLSSPSDQIMSITLDALRSKLPQMELDCIFASYEEIALDLHRTLNGSMNKYGFSIEHALLTHIQPDDLVKHSMNEIQASKRMKEAAPYKAEAAKIELVKDAEAKAEKAHLNGIGIARQRRAIAAGMQEVFHDAQLSNATVSSKGVMDLLVLTQYMDVITSINAKGKDVEHGQGEESFLMLTHMPDTVGQLHEQVEDSFVSLTEDVQIENLLDKF